ncbi:uncharacterized protein LOC125657381 [Ostrea edulis]|uniref:uncharacterized protein LOC125657381 n=1 Tax=Ostrea edulis TaxID=37623 RepID=UPI0024AF544B|nr:uncharacterized protein LOC125657381 [Ostrea edulis]
MAKVAIGYYPLDYGILTTHNFHIKVLFLILRKVVRYLETGFCIFLKLHENQMGGGSGSRKKEKFITLHFLCLAHTGQKSVPNGNEKEVLNKAGLGKKKILLKKSDDEKELAETLISKEVNEDGDFVGFPKLADGGGFELLRSTQNCRDLTLINCSWSAKELQKNVNPQVTIYIRPIQKNLSTEAIVNRPEKLAELSIEEKCVTCGRKFLVRELRKHTETCDQAPSVSTDVDTTSIVPVTQIVQTDVPVDVNGMSFFQGLFESNDITLTVAPTVDIESVATPSIEFENVTTPSIKDESVATPVHVETVTGVTNRIVNFCKTQNILDPVEILRKVQNEMVTGRPLEVVDVTNSSEGDTNFILVDRTHLLETSFDEIKGIEDLRKTLEVQFYDETAVDYGGPRKEFFRLVLQAIKEKYFDSGLRELLHEDYEVVGKTFALSILQNGKIPTFLDPDVIQKIFSDSTDNPCITSLRGGLETLGLYSICMQLPSFLYLFQKHSLPLTFRMLTFLLKPQFSQEGSNNIEVEKKVYAAFVRYLREVASGRREHLSLANVLQFVTGADEEPLLGFKIPPTIQFPEVMNSFIPTANTCINSLQLPRPKPDLNVNFPLDEKLFELYDYAFLNLFYGLH